MLSWWRWWSKRLCNDNIFFWYSNFFLLFYSNSNLNEPAACFVCLMTFFFVELLYVLYVLCSVPYPADEIRNVYSNECGIISIVICYEMYLHKYTFSFLRCDDNSIKKKVNLEAENMFYLISEFIEILKIIFKGVFQ